MNILKYLMIVLLAGCSACKPLTSNHQTQSESSSEQNDSNQTGSGQRDQGDQLKDSSFILQVSQDLANDVNSATKLQENYQALKKKFAGKAGNNSDSSFVGMQGIKDALRKRNMPGEGDLSKFIAWAQAGDWKQFGPSYHHYDWWMFPIDRSSSGQGLKFTIYAQDIQALKSDLAFLRDYRLGAILLIQSWGWDVKNKRSYAHPSPEQKWRNWDVRLGKLAHSLILFEQWDLYDSLKAYVKQLTENNIQLESWVQRYFVNPN
jgi:hypothetical protein